jgi:hypothetical protein
MKEPWRVQNNVSKFKVQDENSNFKVASSKLKPDEDQACSHPHLNERRTFNFELATLNLKLI